MVRWIQPHTWGSWLMTEGHLEESGARWISWWSYLRKPTWTPGRSSWSQTAESLCWWESAMSVSLTWRRSMLVYVPPGRRNPEHLTQIFYHNQSGFHCAYQCTSCRCSLLWQSALWMTGKLRSFPCLWTPCHRKEHWTTRWGKPPETKTKRGMSWTYCTDFKWTRAAMVGLPGCILWVLNDSDVGWKSLQIRHTVPAARKSACRQRHTAPPSGVNHSSSHLGSMSAMGTRQWEKPESRGKRRTGWRDVAESSKGPWSYLAGNQTEGHWLHSTPCTPPVGREYLIVNRYGTMHSLVNF